MKVSGHSKVTQPYIYNYSFSPKLPSTLVFYDQDFATVLPFTWSSFFPLFFFFLEFYT